MTDNLCQERNKNLSLKTFFWVLSSLLLPLSEGSFQAAAWLLWGVSLYTAQPLLKAYAHTRWFKTLFLSTAWIALCGFLGCLSTHGTPRMSGIHVLYTAPMVCLGIVVFHEESSVLKKSFAVLVCAALVASLCSIAQVLKGSFPGEAFLLSLTHTGAALRPQMLAPSGLGRAAVGFLWNRIKWGETLSFVLVLATARTLYNRSYRVLLCLPFGFCALYFTYAKASFVACVAVCVLLCLYRCTHTFARILPLATCAVHHLTWISAVVLGATSEAVLPVPEGSLKIRPWIWSYVLKMHEEHRGLGIGLGRFKEMAPLYSPSAHPAHAHSAHNDILHLGVESGLCGMLGVVCTVTLVWWMAHKAWTHTLHTPHQQVLRLAATGYLTLLMLLGTVHHTMAHPTTAILFWLCTGVLMAHVLPAPKAPHTLSPHAQNPQDKAP